jgi:hypothetical protein
VRTGATTVGLPPPARRIHGQAAARSSFRLLQRRHIHSSTIASFPFRQREIPHFVAGRWRWLRSPISCSDRGLAAQAQCRRLPKPGTGRRNNPTTTLGFRSLEKSVFCATRYSRLPGLPAEFEGRRRGRHHRLDGLLQSCVPAPGPRFARNCQAAAASTSSATFRRISFRFAKPSRASGTNLRAPRRASAGR